MCLFYVATFVFVVCGLLSMRCDEVSLSGGGCSLSVVSCVLFGACRLLYAVCCLVCVRRRALPGACCSLCCLLYVI